VFCLRLPSRKGHLLPTGPELIPAIMHPGRASEQRTNMNHEHRKAGHFRYVEFHIKVDPEMSVGDSHAITVALKQKIKARFPDTSVLIHIEPCDGNCGSRCLDGCLLPEKERGDPKGIR
jgi:hypothetical protein